MHRPNIVFLADSTYYKNMNARVCYDFITKVRDFSKKYTITIFWTDEDTTHVHNKIVELNPQVIIVFEINSFQLRTQFFDFIFQFRVPVYVFLDDMYYINRNTSGCQYVNQTDGIIYWYRNHSVFHSYSRKFPRKHITHVGSRYTNTDVFRDRGLEKKYDILLYGSRVYHYEYKREEIDAIQDYIRQYETHTNTVVDEHTKISFYPLRCKLESVLNNIRDKYRIKIVPESCYDSKVANEELSTLINESYMTVACSSIADVLLHKYLEIPASNSVILGDIPSDYKEVFEGNIVEVNAFMSLDEIQSIIENALQEKAVLVEKGKRLHDIVHMDHNLRRASQSFDGMLDEILLRRGSS